MIEVVPGERKGSNGRSRLENSDFVVLSLERETSFAEKDLMDSTHLFSVSY